MPFFAHNHVDHKFQFVNSSPISCSKVDFIVKVDWILHGEYRILPLSLGVKPNQSVANTEAMAPKVKKMGSTPKWKCLKLVPPSAHDLCIIAIFFLKNGIVPGDSWGLGSQGPAERHVAPQKLPLKVWEAPPAQTVPVTLERCKYPCSWVTVYSQVSGEMG